MGKEVAELNAAIPVPQADQIPNLFQKCHVYANEAIICIAMTFKKQPNLPEFTL